MKLVGITGSIGAGKSYIGNLIGELGGYVYNMDDHVKYLQETDPWLREEMIEMFGADIYTDEGLDRKKVGSIIFQDPAKLKKIEDMIRGPIEKDLYCTAYHVKHTLKYNVMFIENAILYETGQYKRMDHVLMVNAPQKLRMERVTEKRGMSEEDFKQRDAIQIDFPTKANAMTSAGIEWTHIWNAPDLPNLKKMIKDIYIKFSK